MATLGGGARLTTCNERCDCPTRWSPCSGRLYLDDKCSTRTRTRTVSGNVNDHKKCSCGEPVTTGVGKAYCKCVDACTCFSCAA